MPIKIYGLPFQHNTVAIMAACKMAGVEYDFVMTNIMVGEHKTPEMLAKFPMHTTPSMEDTDNGTCMTETCAVLRYIARKGGSTTLFPSDLKLSGICDMVMDHKVAALGTDLFKKQISPGIFGPKISDEDVAAYVETMKTRQWPAVQKFIDENGGAFVCGKDVSVADLCIWGHVKVLSILKPESPLFTEVKGFKAWFDAVEETIGEDWFNDANWGFWQEKKKSLEEA